MENVNERVLAYQLAKEIDLEDLDGVSGGSAAGAERASQICSRPTGKISADNHSWETSIDYSVDW